MTRSDSESGVILVEDDEALREATAQGLELAGLTVEAFDRAESVLERLEPTFAGVVVSDIRLPGMDGMGLLAAIRALDAELPVILVTGHGDVPLAVAALKQGATDFLAKPFAIDHLVAGVRRALAHRSLVIENRRLRQTIEELGAGEPMLGASPPMMRLRLTIAEVAEADVDVLVQGESGTGKSLVAALLHRQGPRRGRPLVTIDCASLVDPLAELNLFGHAGDSVPHTRLARDGLIAGASGGTLVLDGVDAVPMRIQDRLLRVIDDGEVHPVGAERATAIDVRVVSTSRLDLAAEVRAGRFSRAFHDRLALTRIAVPALRTRGEDRRLLFTYFLDEALKAFGRAAVEVDEASRDRVLSYEWPGNVRELRSYAFQLVQRNRAIPTDAAAPDLRRRVAAFEAAVIVEALHGAGGNVARAIEVLGIPRKTFYDKLARHGISADKFRAEQRRE